MYGKVGKNQTISWKNLRSRYEIKEKADTKETTLERADFTLQLLMFVTAEKQGQMFIFFFLSIFCQLLSPGF